MRRYSPIGWEIDMMQDRFPEGCSRYCECNHPAEDCGCEDCQRRHAYVLYFSTEMRIITFYRLN